MENRRDRPLVVVDPGHGGWDNGASWEGRLEKNDNLALALEVSKQLRIQNIPHIMTRDTDEYVTLSDRTKMANEAEADLFVSLHRNSYPEQTPTTMGVENYIYLTAPEADEKAARIVLQSVADVGVQANRGVNRGNYHVLRETTMPSMLLEMGFIINDIDNQLFDEHLVDYAAAIARGIIEFFGLTPVEIPGGAEPSAEVLQAQIMVAERFGLNIPQTGINDQITRRGAVMALQMAINNDLDAQLEIDGNLGPQTAAAFGKVYPGSRGNVVLVLQLALMLAGYSPGMPDGVFGPVTQSAVMNFQINNGLEPSGVADEDTLLKLMGNR